jgi:16S rRNA A1518/A1519 N6-dimethyltransferase RsmA/KsgA/DIM1 with predicted DNA glycosylase/AP lyase activity
VLSINYSTIVDPILKDVRTCVVELSGVKASDGVLDVGYGTGGL